MAYQGVCHTALEPSASAYMTLPLTEGLPGRMPPSARTLTLSLYDPTPNRAPTRACATQRSNP
jgi:hypothetical protein